MPRSYSGRLLTRAAFLTAVLAFATPAVAAAESATEIGGQIVVRQRAALTAGDRAELRADAEVTLDRQLPLTGVDVVEVDGGSRADALRALRADPNVLWAEPNRVVRAVTADTFWDRLWGLDNDGDVGLAGAVADADVDAPEAWTVSRGAGITVGVVDTGVASTHPDLAGQLETGQNFVADGHLTAADGNGHGTHVAGTIVAAENTIGVVGVAPAAKVKALRALGDDGIGSSAAVASAFAAAGAEGLRIVNASLGSPGPTNAERQAITTNPNTLFVVAAGNDGANVDAGGAYPCAYTYANVLCVGASDQADLIAYYSNRGAISVDLLAPGHQIASTWLSGGYAYSSGTSMASPIVAGTAALVVSAHPDWTVAQVKAALMGSVDHPPALAGLSVTGGRLNAARALGVDPDGTGVLGTTPTPTATPTPSPTPAPAVTPTPLPISISTPAPSPIEPEDDSDLQPELGTGDGWSDSPAAPPAAVIGPGVPAGQLKPPAAAAQLSRVRLASIKRRPRAITFELSAAGTVTIAVQRRSASGRFKAVRTKSRSVPLGAGAQSIPVGRGATGLGLGRGVWKVTLSGPTGRFALTFRIR